MKKKTKYEIEFGTLAGFLLFIGLTALIIRIFYKASGFGDWEVDF